jgi:hypothetical protein
VVRILDLGVLWIVIDSVNTLFVGFSCKSIFSWNYYAFFYFCNFQRMLSASQRGIALVSRRCLSAAQTRSPSDHKTTDVGKYRIVDHSYDAIVVGAGKIWNCYHWTLHF